MIIFHPVSSANNSSDMEYETDKTNPEDITVLPYVELRDPHPYVPVWDEIKDNAWIGLEDLESTTSYEVGDIAERIDVINTELEPREGESSIIGPVLPDEVEPLEEGEIPPLGVADEVVEEEHFAGLALEVVPEGFALGPMPELTDHHNGWLSDNPKEAKMPEWA